jgi:hypothetical protein
LNIRDEILATVQKTKYLLTLKWYDLIGSSYENSRDCLRDS